MSPWATPEGVEAANAAHARYLGTSHFASLDGLRFFSIVPVVWHHSTPRPLEGIFGRGPLGVDLFFAISGFLITTLMIREKIRTGRLSVGRFYARRSLRIFPLYYVVLSLYVARAIFFLPESPQRAHFFRSLPFYATYTSTWFVDFAVAFPVIFSFAWSLATEEQFYAFWPWIMARARSFHLPALVAGLLLVATQGVEWGLLTSVLAPDSLARRIAGSISSPMCLGILLAWALHERRSFGVLYGFLGLRWSAPLILAALAVLIATGRDPLLAIRLAMTLLVGACCIEPGHGLVALTDAAPVRWIGKVSYGIYLLHVAAVTAAKHILPPSLGSAPLVFVVAFAGSVAAASASYVWFERPFLRMRDFFRPGLRRAGLVWLGAIFSLVLGCGSRTGIAADGIFDNLPALKPPDARLDVDADADADASLDADAREAPDDTIDPCGLVRVGFDQLRPVVMLLVDQSGSMNDHYPTPASTGTRWSVVHEALMDPAKGAVKQLESSVRFGVTFFTSHGGFRGGTCPILTDVSAATDNYDAIRALYDRTAPDKGDTPTGESIEKVTERILSMGGPGQKFILLVTDGAPDTCARPNGFPQQAQTYAVGAALNAFEKGIRLFILGVSGDIEGPNLQQLANAGQGKAPYYLWGRDPEAAEPYRASDNVADLSPQIVDILNHVPFCDIRLRRDIDADTAAQGEIILDGQKLVYDDADGWRLKDSRDLEIVGKACEAARAKGRELVLKFPCDKDAAPDGPDASREASADVSLDALPMSDAPGERQVTGDEQRGQ